MIVDHEYVCIYIYMYIDCGILILDKNGILYKKSKHTDLLLLPLRSNLLKIKIKSRNTKVVNIGRWLLFNPGP